VAWEEISLISPKVTKLSWKGVSIVTNRWMP
jgi:hypothetical protein